MQIIKVFFKKYIDVFPYVIFGILTTVVNILSYWILAHPLQIPVLTSTVIAWILAVFFAYITNRKWVFKSQAKDPVAIFREIVSFFLARLTSGFIDWGAMLLFVSIMAFNDVVIKTIVTLVVIIFNYIASKFFIFKHYGDSTFAVQKRHKSH